MPWKFILSIMAVGCSGVVLHTAITRGAGKVEPSYNINETRTLKPEEYELRGNPETPDVKLLVPWFSSSWRRTRPFSLILMFGMLSYARYFMT